MSAKVISIFSNKGGVGKTFVAVNLATSLALMRQKVLVIDLDFQAGLDMARMFNLTPRSAIVDVFSKLDESNDPNVIRRYMATHACGLDFIPAVKNTQQIGYITPENILPFFKKATQVYDYIIVDAGKSFNETLISVFDQSNLILLVATPDILAVYQIKWCLEVLQNLHFPLNMIKLVLNRSESRGSVAWQEVKSALTCEIFGHIPSDGKEVGLSVNRGVPCVIDNPRGKVAESFNRMAMMLGKESFLSPAIKADKLRTFDGKSPGAGEFWQKFGIQQQMGQSVDAAYSDDDVIIALKKKIHEKLIDRLNLDGITVDDLRDQKSVLHVKRKSEEVVANLLQEEAGGKITSHEERISLVREIVNEALGLGPLEDFLGDPDVTDIMVNNRNEIYVEKHGKIILTKKRFISDDRVRAVIDRIIAPLGRRIDESTPMVDARLPDGSRINAIIPPLSLRGPMITIRKFGKERLVMADLLSKHGSLNKSMADFLNACVLGRKNIIVSGGTGAGKTTLLNVISECIPDNERILTIEDAAELQLKKSHVGRLESRPRNVEGKGEVTIRDLFINSLRMRPDRIIIGECRGAEALDMLQAMNTGHDGSMTTLHANSTRDVLTRLHSMILLSGIDLPGRAINEMVSSAIHIIVHISRFSDGSRKITGVAETTGMTADFQLKLEDIFVFKQKGIDSEGTILGDFEPTGYVPKCFEEFQMRGFALDRNIFTKTL